MNKKRPRRASAPSTAAVTEGASKTPDADWGDWLSRNERPKQGVLDDREAWMHEQRPPHWD